jgi:hypothetical protein
MDILGGWILKMMIMRIETSYLMQNLKKFQTVEKSITTYKMNSLMDMKEQYK